MWYTRYTAPRVTKTARFTGARNSRNDNGLRGGTPRALTSTARAFNALAMRLFSPFHRTIPRTHSDFFRRGLCLAGLVIGGSALVPIPVVAQGQPASSLLISRADLTVAAERAELVARSGNSGARAQNAALAASIRQRLRDGDFQIGDRVIVAIMSDVMHRDTLVVRTGGVLELPGKINVSLSGVLRSELQERVSAEVLKYVKAQEIEVTPLLRVGVLGEVARPGYFAFASDIPITDAIMGAGGPTATADLNRSVVRRAGSEYRSAEETRKAIAAGLTLDQFGLRAGDELVIGRGRQLVSPAFLGLVGAAASLITIMLALSR